jgi:hypothetical protein
MVPHARSRGDMPLAFNLENVGVPSPRLGASSY